ncbi:hypothetical protein [Streptomyces chartreusis]|uniref:hypothetical protein n=1 Tax=Streptomyces chartreusis TaxID=1969 RepID=UPI0033E58954
MTSTNNSPDGAGERGGRAGTRLQPPRNPSGLTTLPGRRPDWYENRWAAPGARAALRTAPPTRTRRLLLVRRSQGT